MKFIQNYHNEHTKIEFDMLIVVILYEFHTLQFAVLLATHELSHGMVYIVMPPTYTCIIIWNVNVIRSTEVHIVF